MSFAVEMDKRMELVKELDANYKLATAVELIAATMCMYAIYCCVFEKQQTSLFAALAIATVMTFTHLFRRRYHGPKFNRTLLFHTAPIAFCPMLLAMTDPIAVAGILGF